MSLECLSCGESPTTHTIIVSVYPTEEVACIMAMSATLLDGFVSWTATPKVLDAQATD